MGRITISQASIFALPRLNKLFTHAVGAHFGYFPEPVRAQVINDHNVPKLLLATLDPRRVILTARSNGRIIGYCLGAAPRTGPAQIFWLYVDPDHRGANVGLTLLSRMLKQLEVRGAHVVSIATHDHRRYYERQGFKFSHATIVDGVEMDILTFRFKQ